jgi:hypothetical protein
MEILAPRLNQNCSFLNCNVFDGARSHQILEETSNLQDIRRPLCNGELSSLATDCQINGKTFRQGPHQL